MAPTKGAAATTSPPTAVPTALAPDATAPIPDATVEPVDAIAVPTVAQTVPSPDRAFPILDDDELIELEKEFTALLLALVIEEPNAFAPISESAEPEAIPTVAPTVPVIAL